MPTTKELDRIWEEATGFDSGEWFEGKRHEDYLRGLAAVRDAVLDALIAEAEGSPERCEILTDIVYGDSGRKVSVADWLRSMKEQAR